MATSTGRRVMIVGTDGLRPDLFDRNVMPTFASLIDDGTRITDYQGVYPTHTRVQMSSLSTGCQPGKHGTVANVYRYEGVNDDSIMNTSNFRHFYAMDRLTGGRALRVPTLGDLINQRGKKLALGTSASSGSTIIWNRNFPDRIVNVDSAYDREDLEAFRTRLGSDPPQETPPKVNQVAYVGNAVRELFLDDDEVEVVVMWFSEPDASLHYYGIGAPETEVAMRACDDALKNVLEGMDERGIRDQFDIIYLSDHGHSSVSAKRTLAEHLDRARDANRGLPRMVTASDYIYPDPVAPTPTHAEIVRLIDWLQEQPWAGAIFTSAPELASYPGVFPFSSVWGESVSDRAPLLSVSPSWSDTANEFGVPGMVSAMTENAALRSTHGSVSPYELHAMAVLNGPSFKAGVESDIPACAIDITPTVLTLLGGEPGEWMDGRVLWETMNQPAGETGDPRDEFVEPTVRASNGFEPSLQIHTVGGHRYVHKGSNARPVDI